MSGITASRLALARWAGCEARGVHADGELQQPSPPGAVQGGPHRAHPAGKAALPQRGRHRAAPPGRTALRLLGNLTFHLNDPAGARTHLATVLPYANRCGDTALAAWAYGAQKHGGPPHREPARSTRARRAWRGHRPRRPGPRTAPRLRTPAHSRPAGPRPGGGRRHLHYRPPGRGRRPLALAQAVAFQMPINALTTWALLPSRLLALSQLWAGPAACGRPVTQAGASWCRRRFRSAESASPDERP